jgi:hypothetical protein
MALIGWSSAGTRLDVLMPAVGNAARGWGAFGMASAAPCIAASLANKEEGDAAKQDEPGGDNADFEKGF